MRRGAFWLAVLASLAAPGTAAARTDAPPLARIVSATAVGGNRIELVADRPFRSRIVPPDPVRSAVNGVTIPVKSVAIGRRTITATIDPTLYGDDEIVVSITRLARKQLGLAAWMPPVRNRNVPGCSFLAGWESPTTRDLYLPGRGRPRVIVLNVDFPDAPATLTIERTIGPPRVFTSPTTNGAATARWFEEDSYGRFVPVPETLDRWLRMSQSFGAYSLASEPVPGTLPPFVVEALMLADPYVDFARFDAALIVHTGVAGETAFTAPPGRGVVLDGKEIRFAATGRSSLGADRRFLVGFGRAMGLSVIGQDFEQWDPMSRISQRSFTAWHKRKLGWIDPEQVRCVRAGFLEVELTPISLSGGLKAVVVPTGPTTALVVEHRSPVGHDAAIGCPPGALVYTVEHAGLQLRRADTSLPRNACKALYGSGAIVGHGRATIVVRDVDDTRVRVLATRS